MNERLQAALDAAARGWPTFRLGYRQKIPLPHTRGFLDATTDIDTLVEWFGDEKHDYSFNIGFSTGGSSGIVVVDIDGEAGAESIEFLQQEGGVLPVTAAVSTGKGKHLYFKMPDHVDIPPSAGKVGLGIDIRGTGSYVVYPPSVHPNGEVYKWDSVQEVADAPQWLVDRDTQKNNETKVSIQVGTNGALIPNGMRNQTATRIAGYFRRFGFNQNQIFKQLSSLPFEIPMTPQELQVIAWSVSRYAKEHDFSGSEYNIDITQFDKEM